MLQTIYESESNFSTTTNKLVVHQRLLDQQKMHNVNSVSLYLSASVKGGLQTSQHSNAL